MTFKQLTVMFSLNSHEVMRKGKKNKTNNYESRKMVEQSNHC